MTISVFPVPVAPERRITESRKKPPPHIPSSSALPEVMRTLEELCVSGMPERGMTTIPRSAVTVKGNSPRWCRAPRILSTSMVRRRRSSVSRLRRITTLSATNSSSPLRLISPYSCVRSPVKTTVAPSALMARVIRKSSERRMPWSP